MKTVYVCLQCAYVTSEASTGKCPRCDGLLAKMALESINGESALQPPAPSLPRVPTDHDGERGDLGWYYWQVEFITDVGLPSQNNFLAFSASQARQRAIIFCRQRGWKICDLDGRPLHLPMKGEPERSIQVRQLLERPPAYYDEHYNLALPEL